MNLLIQKLKEQNKAQNQGRGVSCISQIISYLENGDIVSEESIFDVDGDKIANYPKLEETLEKILGLKGRYK